MLLTAVGWADVREGLPGLSSTGQQMPLWFCQQKGKELALCLSDFYPFTHLRRTL